LLVEQCRESLIHTRRQLETGEITGQVDVEQESVTHGRTLTS
jgi:hypothetical protein